MSARPIPTAGPGSGEQAGAIQARLLSVDAPEWASLLRSTRHDFYHLPSYAALCAAQEHGEPRALHVVGAQSSMLLPLVVRAIPGGGFDATSPYGYPGPLVGGIGGQEWLPRAFAAGMPALRAAGLVTVFVRLHPLLNPSPSEGVGTLVRHGETVSVDLTISHDEMWAQTRLNHRRDIARTLRSGYVARMDDEWKHLATFTRMYRATMSRRSAAHYYFFDDGYFDSLRDALGERLHLCVVERDGAIAAAGLFVETDGLVQYHLSGTGAEFVRLQPTKLMIHFVRGWAKERGNRVLHLGGGVGSSSDSLLQFKAGFSPLRHPFSTLRMVIDEQEYRRLVVTRDALVDPEARTDFFPLYRHP